MRPEITRNHLGRVGADWRGWYTPFEKRRLKRRASKMSRAAVRTSLRATW